MFMQQFCGINVIAYYSSTIFRQAGFDEITALGATLGFGALKCVTNVSCLAKLLSAYLHGYLQLDHGCTGRLDNRHIRVRLLYFST